MFPGQHNGFLLGESGYPCLRFLMTPILHPASPAEERFNNSLWRTRVLVEQTFGILKRRFQCLHSEVRTTPHNAVTYIVECCHIYCGMCIAIDQGDIINIVTDDVDLPPPDDVPFNPVGGQSDGAVMRGHLVAVERCRVAARYHLNCVTCVYLQQTTKILLNVNKFTLCLLQYATKM